MEIDKEIVDRASKGEKMWAVLIDPDKTSTESIPELCGLINMSSCDYVLVGGSLINKEKFNLYIGGEFMVGRSSNIKMALHSLYLMPSLLVGDKLSLNTRLGLSQINTNQVNFDLNAGYLASIGIEYQLSNKMFPVADHIYKSILSIPLYTAMTDQDQDLVIEAFNKLGCKLKIIGRGD